MVSSDLSLCNRVHCFNIYCFDYERNNMGSNSEEVDQEGGNTVTPTNRILFEKWQHAKEEWEKCSSENEHLRELISNLEFQVETLHYQVNNLQNKADPDEIVSYARYKTDEEELANETEWIRVKHQKTKKRKTNKSPSTSPSSSNVSPTISPRRKVAQPQQKPTEAKKARVPPPIMVEKVDSYEELYAAFTKEIDVKKLQFKLTSANSAKINATDEESFRAVIRILEKENRSFHTYENKQNRPIRVMIKELHHTCKPNSIIDNLKEQGFEVIDAVNKLSFKNKNPLNMFMVTFENKQNIEQIYKITTILGCRVNVEAIKGSKLLPQCKKCQAFGHTRTYCSRQYRCVKCAGKHATIDCKKIDEAEAKCVNCGGTHPASYRGCIVAKELQAIRNKKLKIKSHPTNNEVQPIIQNEQNHMRQTIPSKVQGLTYANVAASTSNANKRTQNMETLDPLKMILEKITTMESSLTSIGEKVNQLEDRLNKSARVHLP